MTTIIRGTILSPHTHEHRFTLLQDMLIHIGEDGVISSVELTPDECTIPITRPGVIWMPGFVDTHVHFPQTHILGSASGELLPWLAASVFPEESKFTSREYARDVAKVFCDAMVRSGTTCASVFGSSHEGATDELFAHMDARGLRADVGMTLMNRGAPEALLFDTPEAMASCERLIERWHNHDRDRLRFCVTPRFALSCTQDLLEAAGALAKKHALPIQTHISENPDEIEATASVFPGTQDYLDVYERAGLVTDRSLFAHGVWLKEREWDTIAERDCAIAHCPDSNFFLGSGPMPLREAKQRGVRMGIGSDIGAGRTFSLRKCCSRAYDASRLTNSHTDAAELLWYATRGGALALGRGDQIGLIKAGHDADLIAITPPRPLTDAAALCDQLVYLEDWDGLSEVRVRNRVVWEA